MTIEERLLEYQKKYLSYEQELTDLVTDWLQKGLDAENIDDWRTKQELIEINEDYKKQEIYQRNNRALLIQAAALVYELSDQEIKKQTDFVKDYDDTKLDDIKEPLNAARELLAIEQLEYQSKTTKTIIDRLGSDYRTILDDIAKEFVSGRKALQQATVDVCRAWANRGLTAAVRRDGSKLSIEGYISSSLRAMQKNVAVKMQEATYDELGIDLVEISSLFDSRISHIPFQAKVYSRSGANPDYPPLSSTGYGTVTGLITGINCRHQMYPYDEETGQTFETYDNREVTENYKQSQYQRELERDIRKAKKELNVVEKLGTDDDIARANAKVRAAQARMRGFINESGRTRRYARERVSYGQ